MIWLDIINTAKLFKTMISDKIFSQLHYWVTQQVCHGMATTILRQAVMVMKCEWDTVWAKQVCTDSRAVNQKWNVKCMSGKKQCERNKSFIKNKPVWKSLESILVDEQFYLLYIAYMPV